MADKADLPDLTQGIPLNSLDNGKIVAGKVGDEDAVMVRDGEQVHCLGGKCTHLGAPMATGRLENGTLQCPWHHAGFCVKTGRVDNPPALHALKRWATEVRGDRVVALAPAPPLPNKSSSSVARIVIVGGGGAAAGALRALCDAGYTGQVTVVSQDEKPLYDRTACSKMALSEGKPPPPLFQPGDLDKLAVTWKAGATATRLDVAKREVNLQSGERLPYDRCLLAMGSTAKRLPIAGADAPHVHTLRTGADAERIAAAVKKGSRVVVVGSSFIGLEAAAALQQRGAQVAVVGPAKVPLANVFGEALGRWVQQLHESKGVAFHLGTQVLRVEPGEVLLEGNRKLPADVVVLGLGVQPSVELAEGAGLRTDNGVLCDKHLRTSDAHVYAAGDTANLPDPLTGRRMRVEHWAVAQKQGMVAAQNMLGGEVACSQPPFFWTRHYTTSVAYVGHAQGAEEVRVFGDLKAGKAAVAIYEAGRITAVATLAAPQASFAAESALARGDTGQLAEQLQSLMAS